MPWSGRSRCSPDSSRISTALIPQQRPTTVLPGVTRRGQHSTRRGTVARAAAGPGPRRRRRALAAAPEATAACAASAPAAARARGASRWPAAGHRGSGVGRPRDRLLRRPGDRPRLDGRDGASRPRNVRVGPAPGGWGLVVRAQGPGAGGAGHGRRGDHRPVPLLDRCHGGIRPRPAPGGPPDRVRYRCARDRDRRPLERAHGGGPGCGRHAAGAAARQQPHDCGYGLPGTGERVRGGCPRLASLAVAGGGSHRRHARAGRGMGNRGRTCPAARHRT